MTKTRTPAALTPQILRFCTNIVRGTSPTYIAVEPTHADMANECFPNVKRTVDAHGGRMIVGWQIWEWPHVLIEAEFHAIWEQQDGTRIDVTPKDVPINQILFLADLNRKYNGRQLDSIRRPLRDDQVIKDFIRIAEAIYGVLNRGDRACQHGQISVPGNEITPLIQLQQILRDMLYLGRRDHGECGCQSGLKYKKCHGRIIDRLLSSTLTKKNG